jgi:hypothetical protein
MKNKLFNYFFVLCSIGFSHSFAQTYIPTKNRFQNINQSRTIQINNKPLTLHPFEMFDIMTFKDVVTGMTTNLILTIPETGEEFDFNEFINDFTYNGSFSQDLNWTGNQATVTLECAINGNLVRVLYKNRKYKVIYGFYNDSKLWRKPYPTESVDGYYIIDIIELTNQFEREKEFKFE